MWKSGSPASQALFALVVSASVLRGQFVQQGDKLVGTGVDRSAGQGTAVALSADGNTAIVGAPDDIGGIGGAWVYTRSGGVWSQQGGKLAGTGALGRARQGVSVALSADGNTAIVGGPGDDPDPARYQVGRGAAWVFTRSGGVWSQQGEKLAGTGAVGEGRQGVSVALSADGNTAIVGGPNDNNQNYGSYTEGFGSAWVFTRSGGVWSQQGSKLTGTGAIEAPAQGASVALSADGNTAIVGGPNDGRDFPGPAGAAWVYTRSNSVWTQQGGKLAVTGVVGRAYLGRAVALSADGNTALVGGDVDDLYAGAAWVFTRSGAVWSQQGGKLAGTGSVGEARQGVSVALSADGNTAIVGGPGDNDDAGAAWVYKRSGFAWNQQGSKLLGVCATRTARQGSSVSLSADASTAIVGGPADNGNTGAAWVFFAGPAGAPLVNCVMNGASFLPGIAPGTWVTLQGSNLSATTRTWADADFAGQNLPTQLDGVSVTINGKPAYIYFISPTQLNVLAPDDAMRGSLSVSVPVQVTTPQGKSNLASAREAALSPALFTFSPQGGKYVAAVRADGAYLGPPDLIPGVATLPAKSGDIILLFGTGFGPTTPPVQIGQTVNSAPLAGRVTVRISGREVSTQYAGVVSPGLYQFNVVVPEVFGGGVDVSVEIDGIRSPASRLWTTQR